MRITACLLLTASLCSVSIAQDYNAELIKKSNEIDGLKNHFDALAEHLERSIDSNPTTAKYVNDLLGAPDKFVEGMKNGYKIFHDAIEKAKEDGFKSADAAFQLWAKETAAKDIYKARYSWISDALTKFKASFATETTWYTKELKKYNDLLDTSVTQFETEVKIPIEQTVESITGDLTGPEREAKMKRVRELQEDFYKISRQVLANEFHEEEKMRSDGNSGIKQIRTFGTGSKNYHSNTHTGTSFSSIHDHSNNIRTIGMGEFIGVLNGIEFRTRHNDYRLKQPAQNDKKLHKTQDIKFPDVPPEVLNAGDVEAQSEEMRKWFKAFYEQDYSVRDYRKYFRPVLTYLEGAWQLGQGGDKVDEPFESDRHHIDATSWFDLQEKARYTSYTGTKSLLENLSHLPTKFIRFTEDRRPVLAQWNYRLMCHPIDGDVPLDALKLTLDAAAMKRNKMNEEKYRNSRSAKFDLDGANADGVREEGAMTYNLIDKIMEQIPGKDNYGAHIDAEPFGNPDHELYSLDPSEKRKLNVAYYHRAYLQQDKNGNQIRYGQRGFSDRLYVAHTTQDRIAHMSYSVEKGNETKKVHTKVSYAIPVEIIFLTPLSTWNPYKLEFVERSKKAGDGSYKNPFNGLAGTSYLMTPHSFYAGEEKESDPADTAKKGAMFIQTPTKEKKAVRTSGVRIMFPKIKGIDEHIRQRYPIMPIYGEGSAVWKKLNALEDALNLHNVVGEESIYLSTGMSHSTFTTGHSHVVEISKKDYQSLMNGEVSSLEVTAQIANAHVHELIVALKNGVPYIADCKGDWNRDPINHPDQVCMDYHENTLND